MQSTIANRTEGHTDWRTVNWRHVNRSVRNLRRRIFKASQAGDDQKVRNLQKLLLRSYANTLQSVRRVTQDNAGKYTAGVDKVIVKTPEARAALVDELMSAQPWRVKPARRVHIPKANGKLRPLGIPTIRDRAMQARVKNALEPEWEARFEASSYGFRPGRSCHDAIEAVWKFTRREGKPWIVDADIQGAFDHIDHANLLQTLRGFPARELVKQWLKAGFVDTDGQHDTPAGTPQGGVISPLLANIALHGMEDALGIRRDYRGSTIGNRALVRYADDFVVMCRTKEDAENAVERLKVWLAERGLQLSSEKTRVVHLHEGFDFLGFNVRRYPVKDRKSGYKTIIKPSNEAVKRFKDRLRAEWLRLRGTSIQAVLSRLNPILTGWANYYRSACSKRTFQSIDNWLFQRQVRYAKHTHPHKGWQWMSERYWGRLSPHRSAGWIFGDKASGVAMPKLSWTKIKRHVKVAGTASPDDPSLAGYWTARRAGEAMTADLPAWMIRRAKFQRFVCPVCGDSLLNGEEVQLHHMFLDRDDSRRQDVKFQKLVHLYCHQQVHGQRDGAPRVAKEMIL